MHTHEIAMHGGWKQQHDSLAYSSGYKAGAAAGLLLYCAAAPSLRPEVLQVSSGDAMLLVTSTLQ